MTQPSAFTGSPSLAPRLAPTPAAPWAPERPALPPPDARLTVRPHGTRPADIVTLAKPLLCAVPHLRAGAPVDLVPPMRRGGTWHLDTRATASRRLPPTPGKVARFAIPALSREHYLAAGVDARPGQFGGALGTVATRARLTFQLGREVDNFPGYFELLPVR